MNELKLVWENNPDTPITASNLSKLINYHTDDNSTIVRMDTPDFIAYGDSMLKIRANSRIGLKRVVTNAFFGFDDSFVSHDSSRSPATQQNVSFRIDSVRTGSKSAAIESGTTNLVQNPDFNNSFSNWVIDNQGGSTVSISSDFVYGTNSASIIVDSSGNNAAISQIVSFTTGATVSISFYYKSPVVGLQLTVEGDPSGTIKYWKQIGASKTWDTLGYIYTLPATTEWRRFELSGIYTTSLLTNTIRIHAFSTTPGTTHFVDAVQLEEKDFCSTFTTSTRSDSRLTYSSDIVDLSEGFVDLQMCAKIFEDDNTIFVLRTASIDAMKLYFDIANSKLVFSIYDVGTAAYKTIEESFDFIANKSQWVRVLCGWKSNIGMLLAFGKTVSEFATTSTTLAESFTPTTQNLAEFQLGGYYDSGSTHLLQGLVDELKINLKYKSTQEIDNALTTPASPDLNQYVLFEAPTSNILLNNSLLDIGTAFNPNTIYYIWLSDDENEASASVVISATIPPANKNMLKCRMIGGFKTNSSSIPLINSLWDVSTKSSDEIHTNRFLLKGTDSSNVKVEFRTTPWGDATDAKFNLPIYFTDHLYGGTTPSPYFDVDPSGILRLSYVQLQGSTISTLGAHDLNIQSNSTQKVGISSQDITLTAGSGVISLDNLRVKTNQLYSTTANDLSIYSAAGKDISIDANTGTLFIQGSVIKFNSSIVPVTASNLDIGTPSYPVRDIYISDAILFRPVGTSDEAKIYRNVSGTSTEMHFKIANDADDKIVFESGSASLLTISGDGNVVIPGDLTVTGTTTFINSTDTNVADSTFTVRFANPGVDGNASFIARRAAHGGAEGSADAKLLWNDATHLWQATYGDTSVITSNIVTEANGNAPTSSKWAAPISLSLTSGATGSTTFDGSAAASITVTITNDSHSHTNSTLPARTAGDTTVGFVTYSGNSPTAGQLNGTAVSPTATNRLNYEGYLYATRVYNAIYNDLADFFDYENNDDEIQFGKVYVKTLDSVSLSNSYLQKGVVGIATDTFGMGMGKKDGKRQIPIAVAGIVLACVDKEYETGTPLTCADYGFLTEIQKEDKKEFPERIIATYYKPEKNTEWNDVLVNSRHWVKVK